MSTISANTIFHFTRSKDILVNILKTGFYPRLCLEDAYFLNGSKEKMAFPMVCFCDIPLSQINNHVSTYGYYAIGLKKKWAIKNGITPVLYAHENSLITKNFINIFSEVYKLIDDYPQDHQIVNLYAKMLYTSFFIKPYQQGKIIFYNEREWRYIISRDIIIKNLFNKNNKANAFLLNEKEFNDKSNVNIIDRMNEEYKISFTPNDINYIIVKKEDEILDIMDSILSIKGNYSYDDVRKLTTRILSIERIKEDF